MSKPSAPAAPDPTATAAAQTQSNIATATANAGLNRVDQYTPLGSSTYDITGTNPDGTPNYSQTVSLSPVEQQLFDLSTQGQVALGETAQGSLANLERQYSTPFDASGLPQVSGQIPGQGDTSAAIKQAQDAAYRTQTQYLDPQFAQDQQSLDAKLANEGLSTGDKAYDNAQQMFGLGKNQAYQGARDAAVTAGNQEQSVLFGQDLSKANLNNSASAQALAQALARYNQPLNEYNALETGAQVQNPSFTGIPGVTMAGTDVAGITNNAYQDQLQAYQAKQAGINNLFSLGGSLGAAAILA